MDEMTAGRKVRLFCSDLDGTLLGNEEGMEEFIEEWGRLKASGIVLVYNTGRLDEDAKRKVAGCGMPEPDFYITGVGTMIYDCGKGEALGGYAEYLSAGWDLAKVRRVLMGQEGIEEQGLEHQHEWKSSWYWYNKSEAAIAQLKEDLKGAGLEAQVIYSSGKDLDVIPVRANKANAVLWLGRRLGIDADEMVVAGDTGNDAAMFGMAGVRGIVPGNAEKELLTAVAGMDGDSLYRGEGTAAAGTVAGLRNFGVFK